MFTFYCIISTYIFFSIIIVEQTMTIIIINRLLILIKLPLVLVVLLYTRNFFIIQCTFLHNGKEERVLPHYGTSVAINARAVRSALFIFLS